MTSSPDLAILLLNWNSAADTLRSLAMISGWTRLSPEVIVVDNGSEEDDFSLLLGAGDGFRLIRNDTNRGYSGGNNAGIAVALEAGYPFIMLLNSDAEVSEGCVMQLLESLEGAPGAGVIGPLLAEHGHFHSGGRNIGIYSNTRISTDGPDAPPILRPVDYVPGTLMIVRRKAFEAAGLLDEEYFFSGEIADFCMRVRDRGLSCMVYTGCMATHSPDSGSEVRDILYNYYTLRNRFLFVRKNFHYWKTFLCVRWVTEGLFRMALATAAGNKEQARAFRLGLHDGVTGRFGDRNDLFSR
jgi:GT2 family glycosyltransferase